MWGPGCMLKGAYHKHSALQLCGCTSRPSEPLHPSANAHLLLAAAAAAAAGTTGSHGRQIEAFLAHQTILPINKGRDTVPRRGRFQDPNITLELRLGCSDQ